MQTVAAEEITRACQLTGAAGRAVCVHASLNSFGWVSGGGATVIQGLLAAGCTVLVPTFSWSAYAIAPPPHLRPPRNGWDYRALSANAHTSQVSRRQVLGIHHKRVYSPQSEVIDREMGALPASLLKMPARTRSTHPLCSFAAIGPAAQALTGAQTADDVFAPLRCLAQAGGYIILMGVGLNRMTLLHAAEKQAGRTLFRRWAYDEQGEPAMFEVGGCSEGFERLAPRMAAHEQRITVGRSIWRVYPARSVMDLCASLMRDNPEITRCADPRCTRCRDAILGGPILVHDSQHE